MSVEGRGLRAEGSGLRVEGSGLRVEDRGLRGYSQLDAVRAIGGFRPVVGSDLVRGA